MEQPIIGRIEQLTNFPSGDDIRETPKPLKRDEVINETLRALIREIVLEEINRILAERDTNTVSTLEKCSGTMLI